MEIKKYKNIMMKEETTPNTNIVQDSPILSRVYMPKTLLMRTNDMQDIRISFSQYRIVYNYFFSSASSF